MIPTEENMGPMERALLRMSQISDEEGFLRKHQMEIERSNREHKARKKARVRNKISRRSRLINRMKAKGKNKKIMKVRA